jgi:hypothetical protein
MKLLKFYNQSKILNLLPDSINVFTQNKSLTNKKNYEIKNGIKKCFFNLSQKINFVNSKIVKFFNIACQVFLLDNQTKINCR